jgi:Zn/Cd-binding protein ZinT
MQYTIRGIPASVDEALREKARSEGKSLNDATIEAIMDGVGLGDEQIVRRDLSDIAGTWKKDSAFDQVLKAQDVIDEMLWK